MIIKTMRDLKNIDIEELTTMSDSDLEKSLRGAIRLANRKIRVSGKVFGDGVESKIIRRELGLSENEERLKFKNAANDIAESLFQSLYKHQMKIETELNGEGSQLSPEFIAALRERANRESESMAKDRMITDVIKARGIAFNPSVSTKGTRDIIAAYEGIARYTTTTRYQSLDGIYRLISNTSGWVDQAIALGLSSSESKAQADIAADHSEFVDWMFEKLEKEYNERMTR